MNAAGINRRASAQKRPSFERPIGARVVACVNEDEELSQGAAAAMSARKNALVTAITVRLSLTF